jgi:hypothetical protein
MNETKALFLMLSLHALGSIMLAAPATSQQNLGGNLGQDRRQSENPSGQGEVGKPSAQTAQVGAGTTNGTTTGYSGPKEATASAPGQNEVPPLPRPELCEPYRNTPQAYQSCLRVVLRD